MARLLTAAAALCVAIFIPKLAAQKQVQLATAVVYTDKACTTVYRGSPEHWPVNLCHPYPVGDDKGHSWGSQIYEVNGSRLVERKFQSGDCSGPGYSSPNQLGPMVGATGSCVPIQGPNDDRYAKRINISASSNSSWTYVPTFSDQGCKTPYGVYKLGNYISKRCETLPPGQSLPPVLPNTTQAIILNCDTSDNYIVCTYDKTDCSGQPTKCVPASAVTGNCSSRPSTYGSFAVYKGADMCASKVPAPTSGTTPGKVPAPTPGPTPASLTCLDVKKMYQAQKCCDTTKASQAFQWSVASAGSTDAKAGRRLSDMTDKIRGLLSMAKAEEGEESARQLAAQFVKLAETYTGH